MLDGLVDHLGVLLGALVDLERQDAAEQPRIGRRVVLAEPDQVAGYAALALVDQFGPACRLAILVEDRFFLDLWLVHEANVADLWETVEVPKFDKDGNPALDKDGNAVMEEIQRPRLMSELPEDLQRVAESASIDGHGRMVPKVYSKLRANAELRTLRIDG